MKILNERLKELRKALSLTQQEFADRLNVSRNTVATYEVGKSKPSDAAVMLICREFNVNEQWLRTGGGDMFIEQTRDEEIEQFIGDLLRDEEDSFKKRLVSVLAALDEDEWETLEKIAISLQEKRD